MALKIQQAIMANCPCYKAGQKIAVKGLMLHSVGCSQPDAQVFVRSFSSPTYTIASVHGFIDGNTGIVYQTLPWNHRAWHCGGACNDTHIGVEMCEPAEITYLKNSARFIVNDYGKARAVATRTYNAAVELFAYLCNQYNLNPLTQIISHNEGGRRGIASGHVDPEHLWTGLGMSYTMDGFRSDVKKAMGEYNPEPAPEPIPAADPEGFIKKIAPIVQKVAPKYKLYSYSAIIAQACLESAYGTSGKAQKHNYFGLKYREGRVDCNSGTFIDASKEQNADGSYTGISTQWYAFDNMEKGVEGYCQFVNIPNYKALKGVTDAETYLKAIRAAGYATSISYVDSVMAVIKRYNLTAYDPIAYKAHCQKYGWMDKVMNGAWAGTQGEGKRLEALVIDPPDGVILDVDVHMQKLGWRSYTGIKHNNDRIIGTVGESRRIEAIRIRCTQNNTGRKLHYQVHCQTFGTLPACNEGETAGTTGKSKRMESIRICME